MQALDNKLLKVPAALFAATLITVMLFYLMQLMVHSDGERVKEAFVIPVFDARMPEIDIEPPLIIEKPEPIEDPPTTEQIETTREVEVGSGPAITLTNQLIDLDPPGWKSLAFQDSEMVPIVRTAPVYPTRALQRQIEGFVVVSFTVDRNGNVENPTVTYAEPEGFFERAALQSIAKWKYAARVVNGEPEPVHGVQQRITFHIAD